MTTDNARSGGPMAATVDRVISRHEKCGFCGSRIVTKEFLKAIGIDAAIRRAAEKAAKEIDENEWTYYVNMVEPIEHHIRAELGL